LVSGEIEIGGDVFAPGRLLVLRPSDALSVKARTKARFMLLGGASFGQPNYGDLDPRIAFAWSPGRSGLRDARVIRTGLLLGCGLNVVALEEGVFGIS
jgi:hypothetical protein